MGFATLSRVAAAHRVAHMRYLVIMSLAALGACATSQPPDAINDPFEGANRGMHAFNKGLDRAVVQDASRVYVTVTPDPLVQGIVLFIAVVMLFQVMLSVVFTVLVVFRTMGKDYEASVISAGFGGITLGSTATAIVNMTAVTKQYGAAPRAFIIVPLVCGFFIDLINALIISFFVTF